MCSLIYLNPELIEKLNIKKCICSMKDLEEAGDEHFLSRIAED